MSGNLAFRGLFHKFSKSAIRVRVLASKIVLKMHCRSSSKYLAIEDVVGGIAKGSRLRVEL